MYRTVTGKIDRPLGSSNPKFKHIIYNVNYGYVEGIFAKDGFEQDVYYLGVDKPISEFSGKAIAVYHRHNDIEDKWIVALRAQLQRVREGYLSIIFSFLGVRFISVNDGIDSMSRSDDIVVPFLNLVNDAYCRDISVKIRSQLDTKLRKLSKQK